jgi:hypothetical protein
VNDQDFADGLGLISDSEYIGIKVDKAEPTYHHEITDFNVVESAKQFVLFHNYDIEDRSILFTHEGLSPEQVTELAIFLQFKAEEDLEYTAIVDNPTVVEFLHSLFLLGLLFIKKSDMLFLVKTMVLVLV